MTQLSKILIYIAIVIVNLIIDLTVTIKLLKNNKKKDKKILLAKIIQKLPDYIKEAENYVGAGNGFAKLNYVLNKINIKCIENGLKFDELAWEYEIENILSTPEKKEKEEKNENEKTENA